MPQIPINPFDNDRLKTRKVRDNLAELGALPSDPSLHPSFLRSRRSAVVLIDRALNALAPDPMLVGASANNRAFASTLNAKFAAAFLVDDGGAGLPAGAVAYADFANGTFFNTLGGTALSDFLVEDAVNWGSFDPSQIVAGQGIPTNCSPVLAVDLVNYIAANGVTFVVSFNLAMAAAPGVIDFDITDFPDYSAEYSFSAGTQAGEMVLWSGGSGHQIDPISLGEHKIAFTFNPSGDIALSTDGAPVITQANEGIPAINAVGIQNHISGAGTYIRGIVFYPPKTNAELPALSGP